MIKIIFGIFEGDEQKRRHRPFLCLPSCRHVVYLISVLYETEATILISIIWTFYCFPTLLSIAVLSNENECSVIWDKLGEFQFMRPYLKTNRV